MRYYDFLDAKLVKKTPFKKVIKAKIKSNRPLSEEEIAREKQKYEIAKELGLDDKVRQLGWSGLTASETGRIGGIMTRRNKERRDDDMKSGNIPTW
ncbi:small, acid-soluble spore protein, alpha/beta type [Oxobacter pfennigii]|uniref:Small, acid-soluble spore protein, alpha/beta type n=1 Tax=Oxobacter pfennigii TaxID=36849 RepID=A0A0P8Y6Z2_9CLOT|nr:small, acid-soluble spore protein, alpha/beta type [Oxobacter pfennigii]KPU42201.1 small, acid-soluble spore protein, alpha/beta type [Oxobacter pfennigii]